MIITINTDASFNLKAQVGTYAFSIVSNLGRIYGAGPIKKKVQDPTEAEMKCIVNALAMVKRNTQLVHKSNRIIINTDCLNAIHIFNQAKKKINKYNLSKPNYQHARDSFFKIRKELGMVIELRHVKGHSGVQDKRSMANDFLDQACKEEMRKLIGPKINQIQKTPLTVNHES